MERGGLMGRGVGGLVEGVLDGDDGVVLAHLDVELHELIAREQHRGILEGSLSQAHFRS